jgi:hypothetical protein
VGGESRLVGSNPTLSARAASASASRSKRRLWHRLPGRLPHDHTRPARRSARCHLHRGPPFLQRSGADRRRSDHEVRAALDCPGLLARLCRRARAPLRRARGPWVFVEAAGGRAGLAGRNTRMPAAPGARTASEAVPVARGFDGQGRWRTAADGMTRTWPGGSPALGTGRTWRLRCMATTRTAQVTGA